MAFDLDSAREAFESSTDFTVGLEEEFQILDPASLELVGRFEDLKAAALRDPVLAESVAGELISSEIEIRSGPGADFADAVARQRDRRRRLFALAADAGVRLGATGTHPLSDYRDQEIIDTEHYRRLNEELRYVAWRNNTWSLHAHVGVRGADRAVAVCDRLRPVLPILLAISANSPYLDQQDCGLHSARTEIFTRTFPRCGVPEPFGSWAPTPTISTSSTARTRSSSSRRSGGRSAPTSPSGRSRCGSATPRAQPPSPRGWRG